MKKETNSVSSAQSFSNCRRCGRLFAVRTPGQEYGPKCAAKLRGQVELDSMSLISKKVLRRR